VFPDQIFSISYVKKIRRLDLSYNNIITLPKEIRYLTNLRELWINHNPIDDFPDEIEYCQLLEVLDISGTNIKNMPYQIGSLKKLHEFDWRQTPMSNNLVENFNINDGDLSALLSYYDYILRREDLKKSLTEKLTGEHYVKEVDNPGSVLAIRDIVEVHPLSRFCK